LAPSSLPLMVCFHTKVVVIATDVHQRSEGAVSWADQSIRKNVLGPRIHLLGRHLDRRLGINRILFWSQVCDI
jgi:hypothetical protein